MRSEIEKLIQELHDGEVIIPSHAARRLQAILDADPVAKIEALGYRALITDGDGGPANLGAYKDGRCVEYVNLDDYASPVGELHDAATRLLARITEDDDEQGCPEGDISKGNNMRELEQLEAVALMQWVGVSTARLPELALLFHIPNGGERHVAVAAKLKAAGVRRGVPDYCLPVARGGFHGLFIELKAGANTATPEQRVWIVNLGLQGYRAQVCNGWQEAVACIEKYLAMPVKIA